MTPEAEKPREVCHERCDWITPHCIHGVELDEECSNCAEKPLESERDQQAAIQMPDECVHGLYRPYCAKCSPGERNEQYVPPEQRVPGDQKAAIPEDLKERHYFLSYISPTVGLSLRERVEKELIERMGRVEAERDQLRMERDAAWNEGREAAAHWIETHGLAGDNGQGYWIAEYAFPQTSLTILADGIRSLARPIPAEPI